MNRAVQLLGLLHSIESLAGGLPTSRKTKALEERRQEVFVLFDALSSEAVAAEREACAAIADEMEMRRIGAMIRERSKA